MIRPPIEMGAFEFAVLASLRAVQLARGCTPRVEGDHSKTVIARREVSEGKVTRSVDAIADVPAPVLES
jgi:DNA-directed RNA polymerase subunit K/omega